MQDLVISLGGSVICPGKVNVDFLRYFVQLLSAHLHDKRQIVVVTGGGSTARMYAAAAKELGLSDEDVDNVGIAQTRVHARLFYGICLAQGLHVHLLRHPDELRRSMRPTLFVLAGNAPGSTTDFDAVQACNHMDIKHLVNISNVKGVYNMNPSDERARLLGCMTWSQLQEVVGNAYSSGMHTPFDPKATNLAGGVYDLVAHFVGADLQNLRALFEGANVEGTVVRG